MKSKTVLRVVNAILEVILVLIIGTVIVVNVAALTMRKVYKTDFLEEVKIASEYSGVERAVIFAVIKAESSFNARAVSKKGAKGLMQITDETAEFIAKKLGDKEYDIFAPETNIRYGSWYLSYLFGIYGETDTVLAAYNAGGGKVNEWLKNSEYSADGKTITAAPYKETAKYIKKVEKYIKTYKKLYKL